VNTKLSPITLAIAAALASSPAIAEELRPVIVSADFRPSTTDEATTSTTIIDETSIKQSGASHLENIINQAPNLNTASGSSRAQYIQIRGVGERSQYEYPVNPSVGLYIDGINFSHSSAAATLFDTEQVEILRGPQGTRFGANALAGIVNIKSKEATNTPEKSVEMTYGSHNTSALGIIVSGPISKDKVLGRIAIQQYRSDGFMENEYLDRTDTNGQDEITAKGHLKFLVEKDHTIDLKAIHIDTHNGYDAWSTASGFTTQSNQPGEDNLKSTALMLKSTLSSSPKFDLISKATISKTKTLNSFDADWSSYDGGQTEFSRDKHEESLEFNLISKPEAKIFNNTTDWVAGIYTSNYAEDMTYYNPWTSETETYTYQTSTLSVFGQFDIALNEKTTLITGLRAEDFKADIKTNNGIDEDHSETLLGGKIGLKHQVNQSYNVYSTLSKGYKPGGLNVEPGIQPEQVPYDTENMYTIEAGINSKLLNNKLQTNLVAFYGKRIDQQVKYSEQIDPLDPNSYKEYFTNAAEGEVYGLEGMANYATSENLSLNASLGLLSSKFLDYTLPESEEDQSGRDQAHAPRYTFMIGSEYYIDQNWTFSANFQAKDAFYISNSEDQKTEAYTLINTGLDYVNKDLTVNFWIRNLTDTTYATRGFYFDLGNGDGEQLYTQQGEPRTFGVTAKYSF
jgi:iron complex outermembrane receptor protein